MSTTAAPLTAGLVTVQLVPSAVQVTLVAAIVPNLIVVPNATASAEPATALTRLVPVTVTTTPPATLPEDGAMPVTVGWVALPAIFHTWPCALIGVASGNVGSSAT